MNLHIDRQNILRVNTVEQVAFGVLIESVADSCKALLYYSVQALTT